MQPLLSVFSLHQLVKQLSYRCCIQRQRIKLCKRPPVIAIRFLSGGFNAHQRDIGCFFIFRIAVDVFPKLLNGAGHIQNIILNLEG